MEEPGKFNSKVSLVRTLLLSLISMLLFCAGSLASPNSMMGLTALLFSPTPMALLGAREDKLWMTAGLLATAVSILLLFDLRYAIYFILAEGFMCFGLTLPLGKLKNGGESLLFCIIASVVSKLVFTMLSVAMTGVNPFVMEPDALRAAWAQMYSGTLFQAGQDEAFNESMEYMVSVAPYMVPSVILLFSTVESFLNYRLCEALQRKQAVPFPALPGFGEWRFPKSLMWALMLAFAMPLLRGEEEVRSLWITLEFNVKFLVLVLFFLQGISLVWWWLSGRAMHIVLRVLIVALLMLPIFGMWAVALGVADICMDFRTRKAKQV